MGFKVITMIKQRNLASYVQTNILDQVSMSLKTTENRVSIGGISGNRAELEQYQKLAIESTKEDQSAELQTQRSVKEFLSQKQKQNEEILKSFQKDVARLSDELQREKRANLDQTKKHDLQKHDRDDHKDSIKELNLKYQNLIMEHETKSKNLERKNEEHQCHKKVLAQEILKLRQENEKLEADKSKYYDALIRIKSSFYETKVFSHIQNKAEVADTKPEEAL